MDESNHFEYTLQLISSFLQSGKSCMLPDIGILKTVYQAAEEKEDKIFPPTSTVILEDIYQPDAEGQKRSDRYDLDIVKEIAKQRQLTHEEAQKIWDKAYHNIKAKIEKGKEVVVPKTGKLGLDKEGHFTFVALSTTQFYKPVDMPGENLQEDQELYDEEENPSKGKPLFYSFLIIIIALLIGTFVYFYFVDGSLKTYIHKWTQKYLTEQAVQKTTVQPQKDTLSQNTVKQVKNTIPITKDSIHFAVIYRKHNTRSEARKDFKQKIKWGYDVAVYTKDSSTYLIGYPYYLPPEDTSEKLRKKQAIYKVNTFIIYPKKQGFKRAFP